MRAVCFPVLFWSILYLGHVAAVHVNPAAAVEPLARPIAAEERRPVPRIPVVKKPSPRLKGVPTFISPPSIAKATPPPPSEGPYFWVLLGKESKKIHLSPEKTPADLIHLAELLYPEGATVYSRGKQLDATKTLKAQGVIPGSVLRVKLSLPPLEDLTPLGLEPAAAPGAEGPVQADVNDMPKDPGKLLASLLPEGQVKPFCDIFASGSQECAASTTGLQGLVSAEQRMHVVFVVGMDMFLFVVGISSIVVKIILWVLDKMRHDPFVKSALEAVFRSLSIIAMSALITWLVFSNSFVHEAIYRELYDPIFGEVAGVLQAILVAPLIWDCMLIAVIYTFVYLGTAIVMGVATWVNIAWVRRAEMATVRRVVDSGSADLKMYKVASFEFHYLNQSRIIPGADPEGQYFGLYMRASLLEAFHKLFSNSTMMLSSVFTGALLWTFVFPNLAGSGEIVALHVMTGVPAIATLLVLLQTKHIKRGLEPVSVTDYLENRLVDRVQADSARAVTLACDSGELKAPPQLSPVPEELMPQYMKSRGRPRGSKCPAFIQRLLCGVRRPVDSSSQRFKHERLFWFQRHGPKMLWRAIQGMLSFQLLTFSCALCLSYTHSALWWKHGPWNFLVLFVPFIIQMVAMTYLMYDAVYVTETGILLDIDRLEIVWHTARSATVRKFGAAVDRLAGEAYAHAAKKS